MNAKLKTSIPPEMKKPGSPLRGAMMHGTYSVRSYKDTGGVYVVNAFDKVVAVVDEEHQSFEVRCVLAQLMADGLNAARTEVFEG